MNTETDVNSKRKRRGKRALIAAGTAFALILIFAVFFRVYVMDYYHADNVIINSVKNVFDGKVHTYSNDDGMVFLPACKEYKAVIVFYPGGKVEYTAYSPFMYELAGRGYVCILPRMPENLAFLRIDAIDILDKYIGDNAERVQGLNWYLAGHSLGGVAAAAYLNDSPEREYEGLILCASYTTQDFSDRDLRLLSIYGSNDKVLNMESYEKNKANWPAESEEIIISGGIHSYFGSYGIQKGDGQPEMSNAEQIKEAADHIADWAY